MKTIYHQIEPYAHCPSICPFLDGTLLSYYRGPECSNEQAVQLRYCANGKIVEATLPNKTGNSILIPLSSDKAMLIFSYFHDWDGEQRPQTPVQRWRYCSNWKTKVSLRHGCLTFSKFLPLETTLGHLVRCTTVKVDGTWLLPAYKEYDCQGVILSSKDGNKWSKLGTIGTLNRQTHPLYGRGCLMQPTLWYDGSVLHSLARDVTEKRQCWYSFSTDKGKTWTEANQIDITNDNNSIVVINEGIDNPLVVWNEGKGRSNLMLGRLNSFEPTCIMKLNRSHSGSYPNYCFSKEELHIVHSDGGEIAHHAINRRELA